MVFFGILIIRAYLDIVYIQKYKTTNDLMEKLGRK